MSIVYDGIRQLIEAVYGICGDYGIAIVCITVAIRLFLLPLNRRQRKVMKEQQKLGVKIEEIKLKYKNNESRRNEELEKLYRGQAGGGMGCLPVLVQFPIMIALYNGIRLAVSASMTTVLLPWVPSLLARDSTYILPAITVFVQMFPQILPYVGFFQKLNLQKMNLPMLLILLFSNSWFAVMLPAGIELYYLVSGLFMAAEQISGLWSESERAETA